jgi:hypothetical protein
MVAVGHICIHVQTRYHICPLQFLHVGHTLNIYKGRSPFNGRLYDIW